MSGPDFWPKSYAKPAEDVGDIPSIDNTVKVGRMNADGTIEYTGTEPAFPTEEERKAKDKRTGHIAESRPRVRVQRVDWDEIWPSIEQRMKDNPSIDAQTLAGHYGVPYLELHIRMQEWKKANVKGADKVIEKKKLTKYTQEERLEMARDIRDLVNAGNYKRDAAAMVGVAPGNVDRWLKELAKVESDEFDKQTMGMIHEAILESVDEGKRVVVDEDIPIDTITWDDGDINQMAADMISFKDIQIPPAIISLDDMKLEWIQDTFGLRMPPNQRLAIIQQIAAIGG